MISLLPLLVTDGDGDDEHPHTRKRTKIQGVITACIDSGVREGLLQMHESEGSWAARMRLAELGDPSLCGGSILATARPWKLTSTSTRSAFAWAAQVLRNPSLVLPAIQAFWTRAQRTPPAVPLGRLRGDTTLSHPFFMQLHSSAITPLKWRFPVSFLART